MDSSNYSLPDVLHGVPKVTPGDIVLPGEDAAPEGSAKYPKTYGLPELGFGNNREIVQIGRRMKIGVVFGGGTAPGSVELLIGLSNYLKRWNSTSSFIGFRKGLKGLIEGEYATIDDVIIDKLINEEGLGCIGTGVHNPTGADIHRCGEVCQRLGLSGLLVVGGTSFMTFALQLSEHFADHNISTAVLGTSKRMEVALQKSESTEISFGFDSVTKLFSFLVGNLCADVASAQSSYHIVRLMGDEKSGSLSLEVALDTHPNVVFINEEVSHNNWSLEEVVQMTCDVICERAKSGKNYGIILLPEGLLNSIESTNTLMDDITDVISEKSITSFKEVISALPEASRIEALKLPEWFVEQIIKQRKTHVNEVHTAQIQVERLFGMLLDKELKKRRSMGTFIGKFSFQSHFYGYEARCAMPSQFDCALASAIGCAAGALFEQKYSGYLVGMRGLSRPVTDWEPVATPLTSMLVYNRRIKTVEIGNNTVRLDGYPYQALQMLRQGWVNDQYRFSVGTLSDQVCTTAQLSDLQHAHQSEKLMRPEEKVKELFDAVKRLSIQENSFLNQRLSFVPPVPSVLRGSCGLEEVSIISTMQDSVKKTLHGLFPSTFTDTKAYRVGHNTSMQPTSAGKPLRIGVVLSGGPAPGGHNVISGLHDYLKTRNMDSVLFGFLRGPSGLLTGEVLRINDSILRNFRNQGGFNMIGTSRTKIESVEQFEKTKHQVTRLRLNGLIICGGDDSNTNAALLADYFVREKVPCQVVGMPKTIDADLRTDILEMSFGFDTATKAYSQLLANVMQDCLVRADRWHFVRLMGRSASHIAVEVALQTRPNYTVVSEEVENKQITIMTIVKEIADLVSYRYKHGKPYGVVVVPEGLIEVSKDMKLLVAELNELLAKGGDVESQLTPDSAAVYKRVPDWLRTQLLSERDPHGNVRVSLIESERLLASLVGEELVKRNDPCSKDYRFWCHFFGYQGRCALVSNFDCTYTYSLGHLAGALVEGGATGVIGAIRNLTSSTEKWELLGIPLTSLMRIERRHGKDKPVIEKKLVDLKGQVFSKFSSLRNEWAVNDSYPRRKDLRGGHLSGVHDNYPTQTLKIEYPANNKMNSKI